MCDGAPASTVPVVRLIEVFRQATQSQMIVNAHRVNRGQMPEQTAQGARGP